MIGGPPAIRVLAAGLLLLSGCDVARSARDDFARLTSSPPAARAAPARKPAPPQTAARDAKTTPADTAAPAADAPVADAPPPTLTGYSEAQLRALLGPPTAEEDHPPGKQWRYRDGKCTLDIQLYPDVETKQYGTLAYKVKSDDDTDEGRRFCVAQLQSRIQARR